MIMIAISWSLLISTAYENITDAPFINSVPNKYQLLFGSTRYMITLLGVSIGLLFAGLTFQYGIRYMLGLSAFFMIFQLAFAYRLIYMRKREKQTTTA